MRRLLSLLALSLVFTGLNALKPLHMDDVAFHRYATQIAAEPLSPYGFELIWNQVPRPAIEILAPPVLPYWWSLGLHLFGQQPVLWKWWLLPFSGLLVFSLDALLRRFVRRHVLPLLWMTVLSPACLPGLNLMTDIPALSLGLFAVTVFLRADERDSVGLALLAGLLAGLAMQTKYTAFTIPVVLVLYATLFRRIGLGLLAGWVAVLLFAAWECWLGFLQGGSHFLGNSFFHALDHSPWSKAARLLMALPTLTGGLAPTLIVVALAALGQSRCVLRAAGAAIVFGYGLLLLVPDSWAVLLRYPQTGKPALTLSNLVYGALGAGICLSVAAVVRQLLQCGRPLRAEGAERSPFQGSETRLAFFSPARRTEWFLVHWLGVEMAGYLVLSPFPAARRVLGVVVVSTLLTGRLTGRTCRNPTQAALLRWVAAGGILLGLVFYGIDYRDAWAQKDLAEGAARLASCHASAGNVWVVGVWGFEFYAERAGLQPLVLGRSQVHKGDRVVVYDDYFFGEQPFPYREAPLQILDRVQVEDALPLRTVAGYYCGATPLRHQQGPRASATVYQVTADFVPRAPQRSETHR